MAGVVARGFLGADADLDRDPSGAQPSVTLTGDQRIGVFDRRHHPRNAGGDHRIGARRCAAVMRAGLQRDVQRRAAGGLTGTAQRFDLGMRTAAILGPAPADDHAILDQHRADRGVGRGAPLAAPAERQRQLHEAAIGGIAGFGLLFGSELLADLLLQDAEDHLRTSAALASSSWESSPSTASKSLASRKLRYTEAKRT